MEAKGTTDRDDGDGRCSSSPPCAATPQGVISVTHHLHQVLQGFQDPAEQQLGQDSSAVNQGLRHDRDHQQGGPLEVAEAATPVDFMYSSTVSSEQYHQSTLQSRNRHLHPWSMLQHPMSNLLNPSHFIDAGSATSVITSSTTSSSAAITATSSTITTIMTADNVANNSNRDDCGGHESLASLGATIPLIPPPSTMTTVIPPLPYSYGSAEADFYARRAAATGMDLQYGYTVDPATLAQLPYCDPLNLSGFYASAGLSQDALLRAVTGVGSGGLSLSSVTSSPFGSLQSEFSKMTAQEIMDAKALAASKSHSEAERRRRERINGHLARLRSLLPNTTKTDKASLLAEVIQHVKELKRQTSEIAEESPVPSESDELTIDVLDDGSGGASGSHGGPGKFLVRASICCEDRSDLLPELIRALKALRLRALKAEIVTLGGRVRNVLIVTGDHEGDDAAGCSADGAADCQQLLQQRCSVDTIQEALKAVMERAATSSAAAVPEEPSSSAAAAANSGGGKRQRTNSLSSILENRSI